MKARGFTLIELVVVVIVIGILAGLLLDRILPLIGQAERVAFAQVRSQIQSALLLEAAERVTRGESATLVELTRQNPMALLLKPPGNYLGPIALPNNEDLPHSVWYFDESDGRLVYVPGRRTGFEAREGPADRIELAVAFVYRDRDDDGRFDPSVDHFDGLRLESVHAYDWGN